VRVALALLSGCERPPAADGGPRGSTAAAAAAGRAQGQPRPGAEDLGWTTYQRFCVGCHGEKGDGNGPAADFLVPRPRDFSRAVFKFGSTPAGSLPLDEDLRRTIEHGLRGTAMPSFALLSTAQKDALVRTVKGFSKHWEEFPPTPGVALPANPFDMKSSDTVAGAVQQGEEIYHTKALCWMCHPVYVDGARLREISTAFGRAITRPDPQAPVVMQDIWGQKVPPPDFRRVPVKSIYQLTDLYRVIAAGVGGTAMPSWDGALSGEEIWALALYIDSLIQEGRARSRADLAAVERAKR
jgi:mono/diheme cytochrome c family protein